MVLDEKVSKENGRTARAAKMVTDKITASPQYLEGLCVDAGDAGRTKCDVNAPRLNNWCRRGIAVELVAKLRLGDIKKLAVQQHASCVTVEAKHGQLVAILRSRCCPNLVSPNDRARPSLAVDGSFPLYVFRVRPLQRQAGGVSVSIAARPAKLRPVFLSGKGQGDDEEKKAAHDASVYERPKWGNIFSDN